MTISVEVTFSSLCIMSREVVTSSGLATAMCAVLNAAERNNDRGVLQGKSGELHAYQQLVQAAQRGGFVNADTAALLIKLSNAL